MMGKVNGPSSGIKSSQRRFSPAALLLVLVIAASLISCLSHLRNAKLEYSRGQEAARSYRTEESVAAFKRARSEAELETRRSPSGQAFSVKGLAEAGLELWDEAGTSFRRAFELGFEPGEEWAAEVALLGTAVSLETSGLPGPAFRTYEHLLDRSKFKPVLLAAARRYADAAFSRSRDLQGKEKDGVLASTALRIDKLIGKDFACGYFHYLAAQAAGHRSDFARGYEEAVMARGLGLPSFEILRDNDNQIVFCLDMLKDVLDPASWEAFAAGHASRARAWGWTDGRTPAWKKR